jgi:hypothetical protein
VARFLERTGCGIVVDHRTTDAAAEAMRAGYRAWKSGEAITNRNAQAIAEFSRERQARQLEVLLEKMISAHHAHQSE